MSVSSLALAFSSNNTASNVLFVVAGQLQSTQTFTVADSQTNTYLTLDSKSNATDSSMMADWSVSNCKAGANTVTATPNFSAQVGIYIAEITGVQNLAANQHTGQAQNIPGTAADAVTTGNVTTTATCFGIAVSDQAQRTGDAPNSGTGFTLDQHMWPHFSATNGASAEWKAGIAAATVAATFTAISSLDDFVTLGAWFAESAASAPFKPIDTDERIFPRGPTTDFAPPNLLAQQTLKLPPFTQANDGARTFWNGVYTDFIPPNLLADKALPPPPVASIDLSQQVRFPWVATNVDAFNLILNTLAPVTAPLKPQDISGIRLDARWVGDFIPPTLTPFLPVASVTTQPAGRHKSRQEAHERHRRDVLRAKVEALKTQRKAAEEALERYESREVHERAKVLKRIRVKSGATYPGLVKLRKPLEQYAPVKKAIVQRNESLANYRAILQHLERAQREYEAHLADLDEDAALHLMHFLMWEDAR